MSWSRAFDDPIPLPPGKALRTLQDAADYVMALPKAEQRQAHWQAAVEALIMAAEDRGPMLHASVGMRRALNWGKSEPERKRTARKYRVIG